MRGLRGVASCGRFGGLDSDLGRCVVTGGAGNPETGTAASQEFLDGMRVGAAWAEVSEAADAGRWSNDGAFHTVATPVQRIDALIAAVEDKPERVAAAIDVARRYLDLDYGPAS